MLTKVFLFSVKTLTVPFWHTVYTVIIKFIPDTASPRLHSLYTGLTHYSSVKKRWSWSHAQLLPTTQIHTVLSGVHELVQKKGKQWWLNDKIVFFFCFFVNPLFLSWESEAPPKSLPLASFLVASSSLQDTLLLTLPSSSLPHPWLHTDNMMVERVAEES